MKKILNNKLIKIILKTIKVVATLFIILLASIILVQRISDNKITVGGLEIYTIISGSMVPKYQIGDMLIAKKVDASQLQVGDDLVYMGEVDDFAGKVVTHEIINIAQDSDGSYQFITKGIANTEQDPIVNEDQIYGKVIYKFTFLSWCNKLVSNVYGFYFIIFVPIVILIFVEIMKEFNYQKKMRNDKKNS